MDRWSVAAIAAVMLGVALLAPAYRGHSQTYDEGVHVATGLEWIERGRYTIEPQHPPLTRIAVAAGPYLAGVRLTAGRTDFSRRMWAEGDSVLLRGPSYTTTLTAARLGNLPFYLLLAVVVWLWGNMLLGRAGAALATGLVALSPPVLGHAALATTDIGLTATVLLAIYTLVRWLDAPTIRRAALLGAATGLALTAKFSAVPYLGLAVVLIGSWRVWHVSLEQGVGSSRARLPALERLRSLGGPQALAALTSCALVVWAIYRFSIVEIGGVPVPAGELVTGFKVALAHSSGGHNSYLLGERSTSGWWYYFPVVFAVKTPLVLIGLGAIGLVAAASRWRADWRLATPALLVVAVLATGFITRINIGVRHVLPMYAAWAVLAAAGALALWSAGRGAAARRTLVAAALLWFTADVIRETPHHLAYFNELSRADPGFLLVDSNLDWGQDLHRLSHELARREISDVSVSLLARPVLGRLSPARVRYLRPHETATGWVAVSETCLRNVYPMLCGPLDWLDGVEPVTRVGRSIVLYDLSAPTNGFASEAGARR